MPSDFKHLEETLRKLNLSVKDIEDLNKDDSKKQRYKKSKWQAPAVKSPEIAKQISEHMDNGYSEEEAHSMSGNHIYPRDITKASSSNVEPDMISDKFFEDHKDLVGAWLDNAQTIHRRNVDQQSNPMQYASQKYKDQHADHASQYKKDYEKHLMERDADESLSGHEKYQATRKWKKDWHANNPEYKQNAKDLAKDHNVFDDSRQVANEAFHRSIIDSIYPTSTNSMSAKEAAQQIGVESKDMEDGGSSVSIKKDPMVGILHKYPDLKQKLGDEATKRLQAIDAHRTPSDSPDPAPAAPAAPKEFKPGTIRRRKKD